MCKECGCGLGGGDVKIGGHSHEHTHDHGHAHGHDHHHEHGHSHGGKTLSLNLSLMEKNNRLAERNRGFFRAKKSPVALGEQGVFLHQRTVEIQSPDAV